ncbi:MAG: ATP-binding protein [Treponema sp.]
MLVEFTVENYRSFKERRTFSLLASKDKDLLEENTFSVNDKNRLVKTAVIYGANAGGKSNLFRALSFFLKFAVTSGPRLQKGDEIGTQPFLFSKQAQDKPSSFELLFYIQNNDGFPVRYRYGFTADKEHIIEEHLYAVNNVREVMLFVRDEQKIEFNTTAFKEGENVTRGTVRENATFLSECSQKNGETAGSIILYFRKISIITGLSDISALTRSKIEKGEKLDRIVYFLQFADIQVLNLRREKFPVNFETDIKDPVMAEVFRKKFPNMQSEEVYYGHALFDGEKQDGEYFLPEEDESNGTRKLFSYAGIILSALDNGSVLFIDEFDSSLHPLIVENIVKLFNSSQYNPKNAQLVVSCQAVNIMTNRLFRRDQIWFCEKDKYGASDLYSLMDIDEPVRKDAAYNKNYLLGKYGAVPAIDSIRLQMGCKN